MLFFSLNASQIMHCTLNTRMICRNKKCNLCTYPIILNNTIWITGFFETIKNWREGTAHLKKYNIYVIIKYLKKENRNRAAGRSNTMPIIDHHHHHRDDRLCSHYYYCSIFFFRMGNLCYCSLAWLALPFTDVRKKSNGEEERKGKSSQVISQSHFLIF